MSQYIFELSNDPRTEYFKYVFEGLKVSKHKVVKTTIEKDPLPSTNLPARRGIPKVGESWVASYKIDADGSNVLVKEDPKNEKEETHLMDGGDTFPYLVYMKLLYIHQYLVGNSLLLRQSKPLIPTKYLNVINSHMTDDTSKLMFGKELSDVEKDVYAAVLTYTLCQHGLFNKEQGSRTTQFATMFVESIEKTVGLVLKHTKPYYNVDVPRGQTAVGSFDRGFPAIMSYIGHASLRSKLDNLNDTMDKLVWISSGINDFSLGCDAAFVHLKVAFAHIFEDCHCKMDYGEYSTPANSMEMHGWKYVYMMYGETDNKYLQKKPVYASDLLGLFRAYDDVDGMEKIVGFSKKDHVLSAVFGVKYDDSKLVLMSYDKKVPVSLKDTITVKRMIGDHTIVLDDGMEIVDNTLPFEDRVGTFLGAYIMANKSGKFDTFGEMEDRTLSMYVYIPENDPILDRIGDINKIPVVEDPPVNRTNLIDKASLKDILPKAYEYLSSSMMEFTIVRVKGEGFIVRKKDDLFFGDDLTPLEHYTKEGFIDVLSKIVNVMDVNVVMPKEKDPKKKKEMKAEEESKSSNMREKRKRSKLLPGITLNDIKGGEYSQWEMKFPESRIKTLDYAVDTYNIMDIGGGERDKEVIEYSPFGLSSIIGYINYLASVPSKVFGGYFFNTKPGADYSGELIHPVVRMNIGKTLNVINNVNATGGAQVAVNVNIVNHQRERGMLMEKLEKLPMNENSMKERDELQKKLQTLDENIMKLQQASVRNEANVGTINKNIDHLFTEKVSLTALFNKNVEETKGVTKELIENQKRISLTIEQIDANLAANTLEMKKMHVSKPTKKSSLKVKQLSEKKKKLFEKNVKGLPPAEQKKVENERVVAEKELKTEFEKKKVEGVQEVERATKMLETEEKNVKETIIKEKNEREQKIKEMENMLMKEDKSMAEYIKSSEVKINAAIRNVYTVFGKYIAKGSTENYSTMNGANLAVMSLQKEVSQTLEKKYGAYMSEEKTKLLGTFNQPMGKAPVKAIALISRDEKLLSSFKTEVMKRRDEIIASYDAEVTKHEALRKNKKEEEASVSESEMEAFNRVMEAAGDAMNRLPLMELDLSDVKSEEIMMKKNSK